MNHRVNTPLSFLLVSTTLDRGGAQRFVSTLLLHLDRNLICPHLCLLREEIGYPLARDVPVFAFDYHRWWHIPSSVKRLRRLLEDLKPDVVLSNITATNLVTGMALNRCCHQPAWIARVGNDPLRHDDSIRPLLARWTYPRVDCLVANSVGLGQAVEDYYPVVSGRVEVLPTPTDFGWIDEEAEKAPARVYKGAGLLLVAVGRLSRQKRYDIMVEAVSIVREVIPVELWICGDGPHRGAIEKLIKRLRLEEAVHFLGFCRNPFAIMHQAHLFLLSSDHEGLPNSLIEAQGLGLPAVATRCEHGPEEIIVDGQTGALVPVGDSAAMAEAILKLLSDTRGREAMASKARSVARERFGVESATRMWQSLISRTLVSCKKEPNKTLLL